MTTPTLDDRADTRQATRTPGAIPQDLTAWAPISLAMLEEPGVTRAHLHVWAYIWTETHYRARPWDLSLSQVADGTGASRATVKRALGWLVERGWLTREHQRDEAGDWRPSVLTCRFPDQARGGVTHEPRGGVTHEPHRENPPRENSSPTPRAQVQPARDQRERGEGRQERQSDLERVAATWDTDHDLAARMLDQARRDPDTRSPVGRVCTASPWSRDLLERVRSERRDEMGRDPSDPEPDQVTDPQEHLDWRKRKAARARAAEGHHDQRDLASQHRPDSEPRDAAPGEPPWVRQGITRREYLERQRRTA